MTLLKESNYAFHCFQSISMGIKFQKKICHEISEKKLYWLPKNWLRRTYGFHRIHFLKFYRSISCITGHLLKNKINGLRVFTRPLDAKIRLRIYCSVLKWQRQKLMGRSKKNYPYNLNIHVVNN